MCDNSQNERFIVFDPFIPGIRHHFSQRTCLAYGLCAIQNRAAFVAQVCVKTSTDYE